MASERGGLPHINEPKIMATQKIAHTRYWIAYPAHNRGKFDYVNKKIYDYAIMIDGAWGSGKTYFIFVFDDLERCSMPINEALGYINHFVEQNNAKVLIDGKEYLYG